MYTNVYTAGNEEVIKQMNIKVRQMVYAGLLIALAIIIPIQFGFLRIVIPPFTATLAAHVPMMLAMLISPFVAIAAHANDAASSLSGITLCLHPLSFSTPVITIVLSVITSIIAPIF